jgi:hypothetical protein
MNNILNSMSPMAGCLWFMRANPAFQALNAAFAVDHGPGDVNIHALKNLILNHKVVIMYHEV